MNRPFRRAAALLAGLAAGMTLLTPTATAATGPALNTPEAQLSSALSCSDDLTHPQKTPVLLIPGTLEEPDTAYAWGYQKVLRAQGHPVCTVRLPAQGSGDMQDTAEYVVYAIRHISEVSGGKISTLGHSQGGLLAAWALRFWPDLPGKVDDAVSLAAPYRGTKVAGYTVCLPNLCPPIFWQVKWGSAWSGAVVRQPIAPGADVTSVGSRTDEVVQPAPESTSFPGATNLMVQDLCPGRLAGHMSQLADAAAYALVVDALDHPGPADLSRVDRSACSKTAFDGIDPVEMTGALKFLADTVTFVGTAPWVTAEPPLRDYARS
ncbi:MULTISPECIES: hypothetical protein [unclassified Streptomyces]|uniref:esterase/lipase family protein n=1 Tax=unclassified Streptomyces TaxID=2593676 RepID=UPI002366F204|nr:MULTISPECIES: hypothetical protein [unclassified Streptomyces]MDF3147114.1 hypothetical protein [Streptomyces sp. T21Q-yed]WDF36056.1 hypothetical protein PBV52_04310 [Streptomyces sp. T12]